MGLDPVQADPTPKITQRTSTHQQHGEKDQVRAEGKEGTGAGSRPRAVLSGSETLSSEVP